MKIKDITYVNYPFLSYWSTFAIFFIIFYDNQYYKSCRTQVTIQTQSNPTSRIRTELYSSRSIIIKYECVKK